MAPNDWGHIFRQLALHTSQGRILILLDEISWMGSKDPDFLGKLKSAWDQHLKKNPALILVLCGSISSWIEKEILNSSAFLGRISLNITLQELPLCQCNHFWDISGSQVAAFDKLKVLSVTGGVPRYLEEINPTLPAEENIRRLCFQKEGFLFDEFRHIFADLFSRKSDVYEKFTRCLLDGSQELCEIYTKLHMQKSGKVVSYLEDLVLSGFLARDYSWSLKDGKSSKLSKFRLKDNYIRFYLKWVDIYKHGIELDQFAQRSVTSLPGWNSTMGLQFENLVLHNRKSIKNILGLFPETIVFDNPYFQHATRAQEECQIDYMIQTIHHALYICEIKFSSHPVGMDILSEMKEKMKRLNVPRCFSLYPVLIHAGEVHPEVVKSGFFVKIIDFSSLLIEEA
ncbi:MAG: ATPase [Chlamydiae bacterium]|nr:ATPase [Chlamydiota bacterium]